MAFSRVREYSLKSVMLPKALKLIGQVSSSITDYVGDNRLGVIKPQFMGNSSDMAKDCVQAFQQTLHVFTMEQLQKTFVTVGEGYFQVLSGNTPAIFIKLSGTKIYLSFTGFIFQGR